MEGSGGDYRMSMNTKRDVNFIGIGAPKAGTSWLAKALHAHPDICLSTKKETLFFVRSRRAIRWLHLRYDSRFRDILLRSASSSGTII